MRSRRSVLALALLAGLAGAAEAEDHEGFLAGAAVGYSSRFERAFVAVDLLVVVNRALTIVPNASYSEVTGMRRWTAGVEAQWNAPVHRLHPRLLAWAGAGLGVLTLSPKGPRETTTRDLVANAVAGVGYNLPAAPFIQVRVALDGPSDVGLSAGVRF